MMINTKLTMVIISKKEIWVEKNETMEMHVGNFRVLLIF